MGLRLCLSCISLECIVKEMSKVEGGRGSEKKTKGDGVGHIGGLSIEGGSNFSTLVYTMFVVWVSNLMSLLGVTYTDIVFSQQKWLEVQKNLQGKTDFFIYKEHNKSFLRMKTWHAKVTFENEFMWVSYSNKKSKVSSEIFLHKCIRCIGTHRI